MQNEANALREAGRLTVAVYTAGRALPLAHAHVTVQGEEGADGGFIRTETDENGKTPTLLLSAPPPSASLAPGGVQPYAIYHIRTEREGFYPVENSRVAIFAGTHALQPVEMIPLPPYEPEKSIPQQSTQFSATQALD